MDVKRVRILKDWSWPPLERQTPRRGGTWDGIEFVIGEGDEPCDLTVVLNNRLHTEARTASPRNRIWVLMQEPYARGMTDWMVEGLEAFSLVLTHHPEGVHRPALRSQPALPWHVNRDYDQLRNGPVPDKTEDMSWILGAARGLRGHRIRMRFFEELRRSEPRVHLFGRAIRPVDDKWDGLAPYRFSLAVENSSSPDYWTEKIADCFLAWTVPLYWGAPNITDYFPREAVIPIPIHDPRRAIEIIQEVLAQPESEWRRRQEAVAEARRLVLDRYQLFPCIAELARAHAGSPDAAVVRSVPPYRRSFRSKINRSVRKLVHAMGWL